MNRNILSHKVKEIQDQHFTSHATVDSYNSDDIEKYIDSVEKAWHERRREEWQKAYAEQLRTKYEEYPARLPKE